MTKEDLVNNVPIKRSIQLKIVEADKTKGDELVEKYKNAENPLVDKYQLTILMGSWINMAVDIAKKGATEKEIDDIIEHIVVIMHSIKDKTDVSRSCKDHNLPEIVKKYTGKDLDIKL